MKRAIIFLIEGLSYSLGMAYMTNRYADHFAGVSTLAVFLIPLISIAVVNLLQTLFDIKAEERLIKKCGEVARWIIRVISFVADSLVFFGFYNVLEYVGNMPASFRTLARLSVLSAATHLVLYEMVMILSRKEPIIVPDQDQDEAEE